MPDTTNPNVDDILTNMRDTGLVWLADAADTIEQALGTSMRRSPMPGTTYTRDEWEKNRESAEALDAWIEKGGRFMNLINLFEPEEPKPDSSTFAYMTDKEHRDYIGGAVEWRGKGQPLRGWYVGTTLRGEAMLAVPWRGRGLNGANVPFDELVPLPHEPRMVIPGVTRPHVQQEPPADMLGWWATYEGERVRIANSKPIELSETCHIIFRHGRDLWVPVRNLRDWSRERDIEGADNA